VGLVHDLLRVGLEFIHDMFGDFWIYLSLIRLFWYLFRVGLVLLGFMYFFFLSDLSLGLV
jgi:hypothetical protein